MNAAPLSRPPVYIVAELDELLAEAAGHGVVKVSAVASMLGDRQRWTVAITTARGIVSAARAGRQEDALREAIRRLSEAA